MPEEELTAPKNFPLSQNSWEVKAHTRKVNKSWEQIIYRSPKDAARCYKWLCENPMQRLSGRVYPLRGKKYKGAWEFEVTGGDRVYYVPNPDERKVVVYFAGPHPNPPSPTPP